MARKKIAKKAKKTTTKMKGSAKKATLTVAKLLKQLPKQFKKELATFNKHIKQLTAALKKATKQKNKASIVRFTAQLKVANHALASLSKQQATFAALTKPMAKKSSTKPKKIVKTKSQKKRLQPLASTASTYENMKPVTSKSEPVMPAREEEVEFNT